MNRSGPPPTPGWGHLRALPPIQTPPKPETRFSTVSEVADALRISKMGVYRMIHTGDLPAYKFGRTLRVPTQAVWDFIRGSKVDPDDVSRTKAL